MKKLGLLRGGFISRIFKRAEANSKGEVTIVLEDLGCYFRLLMSRGDLKREDDGCQKF